MTGPQERWSRRPRPRPIPGWSGCAAVACAATSTAASSTAPSSSAASSTATGSRCAMGVRWPCRTRSTASQIALPGRLPGDPRGACYGKRRDGTPLRSHRSRPPAPRRQRPRPALIGSRVVSLQTGRHSGLPDTLDHLVRRHARNRRPAAEPANRALLTFLWWRPRIAPARWPGFCRAH